MWLEYDGGKFWALYTIKYLQPYNFQWLNNCCKVKVKKQVVSFRIKKYEDKMLCDAVLMQAVGLLLERP